MVSEMYWQASIKSVMQTLVLHFFQINCFVFSRLIYAFVYDTKFREMLQNSKHMTSSHKFVLLLK